MKTMIAVKAGAFAAFILTAGLGIAQTPVTVTNTPASPVPVKDQDQPAKHPVTLYAQFALNALSFGSPLKDMNTNAIFTVPIGKRLVVESFSAYGTGPSGPRMRFWLELGNSPIATVPSFHLPTNCAFDGIFQGQKYDGCEGSMLMRWYVDEGKSLYAGFSRLGSNSTMVGVITVTGHVVDMPPPGVGPGL